MDPRNPFLASAILAFLLVSPSMVHAEIPADDPGVLHYLLIADSNDRAIGPAVRMDVGLMEEMIASRIPKKYRNGRALVGNDCSPQEIRRFFREVMIGPNDALMFYYSGHGLVNPKNLDQIYTMGKGTITRNEIINLIQSRKPRLGVVLADCCSNFPGQPIKNTRNTGVVWTKPITSPRVIDPVAKALFFGHKGLCVLAAAEDGCVAATAAELGGSVFTVAFKNILSKTPQQISPRGKGFTHWKDFSELLHQETNEVLMRSKGRAGMKYQYPALVQLPTPIADAAVVGVPTPKDKLKPGEEPLVKDQPKPVKPDDEPVVKEQLKPVKPGATILISNRSARATKYVLQWGNGGPQEVVELKPQATKQHIYAGPSAPPTPIIRYVDPINNREIEETLELNRLGAMGYEFRLTNTNRLRLFQKDR
jgi:hypothetical protein